MEWLLHCRDCGADVETFDTHDDAMDGLSACDRCCECGGELAVASDDDGDDCAF